MLPGPKKRSAVPAAQAPRTGLHAAFASLDLPALPVGAEPAPTAAATPEPTWKMGRVVLRRETARRGGKTVIVVHEFAPHLPVSVIEEVARKLRTACGSGGTVRERRIEIQGDQPARIRATLEAEGFQVAGVK